MVLITCVARSATHERQHLGLEEQTSPLEAVPPYTAQTAGKRGVPISAQEDGMQVVPLVELADQNESCDSAKGGDNVSKMSYKSVYTKEKGNSIRLQSLVGKCVSKGSLRAMETKPRSPVSAY